MRSLSISFLLMISQTSLGSEIIPNQYIVKLKPKVSINSFNPQSSKVLASFRNLDTILVETSELSLLESDPNIEYIQPNEILTIYESQSNPPWNLDRIDAKMGLDKSYTYSFKGRNTNVYVVDTGVLLDHQEFSGRVSAGFSAIGGSANDCNGHGTHVAGIVAGNTYGVAKQAIIHPVRVMHCNGAGTTDRILAGLDWILSNARFPAIVNLSLGGSRFQALNDAVSRGTARGILFVVAAGNSANDACFGSPSSAPEAITVAASDINDASAGFSNFGRCVDLYAPGVQILSSYIGGFNAVTYLSGTSMASPHVAGAAALLFEKAPTASPATISNEIIQGATIGIVKDVPGGTDNRFLFVQSDGELPPPNPDPEPIPNPGKGIPVECALPYMCLAVTDTLSPNRYFRQLPDRPFPVNYPRPLHIYVDGEADFDLFLFYSDDSGQSWSEISRSTKSSDFERIEVNVFQRGLYAWIVRLKDSTKTGQFRHWFVY